MDTSTENLQELSEPELLAQWAAAGSRLSGTAKGKPGQREVNRRHDGVAAGYRRQAGSARRARLGSTGGMP